MLALSESEPAASANPADLVPPLSFTGERYLPFGENAEGSIHNEHLHRYAFAREFVRGLEVLDVACGEGYGTAFLAQEATRVVGVDVDAATVTHAAHVYQALPNASFVHGDCADLPLPDKAFDVVVSFETIEHHDKHEEMIAELRRVLRPGGLLIISSPNRRVYSDETGYQNPFHVKELYGDEFKALLARHFQFGRILNQSTRVGSFLYANEALSEAWSPVSKVAADTTKQSSGPLTFPSSMPLFLETASEVARRADDTYALYYVALASDDPARLQGTPDDSAFVNLADSTLATYEAHLTHFDRERTRLENDARGYTAHINELAERLQQTEEQLHNTRVVLEQERAQAQERVYVPGIRRSTLRKIPGASQVAGMVRRLRK